MTADQVANSGPKNSWIGVVSDTHGHILNTCKAVKVFERMEVEAVLHCGDIGSPDIPPLFAAWPTHYVLGNVDGSERQLREAIDMAGGICHGRFGALSLKGRKIALLHGDDEQRFREVTRSGDWELVCHGHTHKASQTRAGHTLILNPGALVRAWPISIAVVELRQMEITTIPLDGPS
jgi:putative phosphoesterase